MNLSMNITRIHIYYIYKENYCYEPMIPIRILLKNISMWDFKDNNKARPENELLYSGGEKDLDN